ncbi:uncharacterized protein BcabD6B2_10860 [Babesia caballi]|uniref:Uncharacterized protein n=2 Tax=Babesia caballi TaxID=5871 RepID=A0AAV4LNN8_BABCB|nr:hypothetical protein, conserved [Babesia caballi]
MAFLRRSRVSLVLSFFVSLSFVLREVDSQIYGSDDAASIVMPSPLVDSLFRELVEGMGDIETVRRLLNSIPLKIGHVKIGFMLFMTRIGNLKISERDKELINDFADRLMVKLNALSTNKAKSITLLKLYSTYAEIGRDLKLGLEPFKLEEIKPALEKLQDLYKALMRGDSIAHTEFFDTLFRFLNITFDMLAGNKSYEKQTQYNAGSAGSNIVPPSASRDTADDSARATAETSQNRMENQRMHSTPDAKTSTTASDGVRVPPKVGESVDVEDHSSPDACINIRRSPPAMSRSGLSAVGVIAVHMAAVTFLVAAV